MIQVPSSEFSKNFGKYRTAALRGPIAVTARERITGYFVSAKDYETFIKTKSRKTRVLATEAISETTIRALAKAKMHPRHKTLDRLMDGE